MGFDNVQDLTHPAQRQVDEQATVLIYKIAEGMLIFSREDIIQMKELHEKCMWLLKIAQRHCICRRNFIVAFLL